ncbi:HAD-IIB family hydrolase [Clostridium sp. Ade.TY]|uniref:HAD-IIB family hydrolase n=1 Tax=Clostridium sp. Ade.TY TaxID=1391647 RepID=UPI00041A831D|nr:HAD-IIB family hydrolase [Clostridium sp. Ade.TY]
MKLLASDFDGTLLVDKEIHKRDLDGIKNLRKEGHKFIVSTGRTLLGMEEVFEKYDLEFDYLVLCNGALILDKDKRVIKNSMIEFEAVKKIIEEFSDEEQTMIYFDNGNGMNLIENKNADLENLQFFEELEVEVAKKEDILNLKSGALILSVFASDGSIERAEKIKERLINMFGDELGIFRNQFFIDIVSKGSSKGNGLKEVLKIENKNFDDIYTVGDSFNDVSMFEITNNSYTFNRAEDGVKIYAKNHIDYVHEIVDYIIK